MTLDCPAKSELSKKLNQTKENQTKNPNRTRPKKYKTKATHGSPSNLILGQKNDFAVFCILWQGIYEAKTHSDNLNLS